MLRKLFSRLARASRDTAGANMLEAAIIKQLLLLLTIATFEFGAVFFVFLALQNGVSQATRYGVTGRTMGSASRIDSVKTAMREASPTLTIPDSAFTFSHIPTGGSGFVGGTGGPGEVEKVTVAYTWDFFTPLMRPFFPSGRITIQVESTMKNEPRFQ
jgi:Flp pilus assembly protein TadG